MTDLRWDQLILSVLAFMGLVFGSGGGVWSYLTWRDKQKLAAQSKEAEAQRMAVRLATETMLAANATLQTTVNFLQGRLNSANADYAELQKLDATRARDVKAFRNGESDEQDRRLRILTTQYNDCRRMLTDKNIECESLKAEIVLLTGRLRALLPTKPLTEAGEREAENATPNESR